MMICYNNECNGVQILVKNLNGPHGFTVVQIFQGLFCSKIIMFQGGKYGISCFYAFWCFPWPILATFHIVNVFFSSILIIVPHSVCILYQDS